MNIPFSRRRVLKTLGVGLAAVLGSRLLPARASASEEEYYGNFVLLPRTDSPVPDTVLPLRPGAVPIGEHLADAPASNRFVANPQALASEAKIPVYTLGNAPPTLRPGVMSLTNNSKGQTVFASIAFEQYDEESDSWVTALNLTASEVFLVPFPVWPTTLRPGTDDEATVPPLKVDFLPTLGVVTATERGPVMRWVEDGVLHELSVEADTATDAANRWAGMLTKVAV